MSKIPEGATHTAQDGTYRMPLGSLWYGYEDGDWVYIEGAAPHSYTKIQAEPEWTGEGLPPLGEHVFVNDPEGILRYGQGESGEVIAHVEDTAVIRMSYGLGCFEARCLRTIEQIEAEDRKEFLSRAHKIYMEGAADHRGGIMALYDAGLRFVEVKK